MSEQTVKAPLPAAAPVTEEIVSLVQAGKRALEQGDLEQALVRFEEVIQRFPGSREGHNNLGALYATLGRHEQAETCFSRVLTLAPGNVNVHYNRGISRIRLRRYEEACADFQAVIQANPTDADTWNNLGVAHFLKGDPATAAANLRQALALTPNYPNAVLNLSDAECARGRTAAAIEACESFLEGRVDEEVGQRLAELLIDESRRLLAKAALTVERHLETTGENQSLRALLGRVLQAQAALEPTPPAA